MCDFLLTRLSHYAIILSLPNLCLLSTFLFWCTSHTCATLDICASPPGYPMSLKSTCPFGLIYSHTILPTRAHLPMFPTAVNKTTLNFLSPETLESPTSFFMFTPNIESVQFSSVAQSCPTLYNPMDCNTPGPPVHHQLPEFTQIHVH